MIVRPCIKTSRMISTCPKCRSDRITTRDYGKRAGAAIGAVTGAVDGFSEALKGVAKCGAAGLAGRPHTALFGGIACAVMGAFVHGAAGGVAGATVGQVIDDNILKNFRCLDCQLNF